MSSYQNLMPGKRSNMRKMIRYVAEYNFYIDALNGINNANAKLNNTAPGNINTNQNVQNYNYLKCPCIPDNYVKYVVGSDSPSIKVSNNIRIAQIINISKGGKTQYGNFYLGQPLSVNYLGRMEGMPGGSGSPPTNF